MNQENTDKFYLRRFIKHEDLYEKNRLRVLELILSSNELSLDKYFKIISLYLRGSEDKVDVEGLTDEVYRFHIRSLEVKRRLCSTNVVIPSSQKGFDILRGENDKKNFGFKN